MKYFLIVAVFLAAITPARADFTAAPLSDLTLKKFPSNFAHTTVHLVSTNNILPFLVGAGACAASTQWDTNVKNYFSKEFRFSTAANIASDAGSTVPLLVATTSLFVIGLNSKNENFHRMTYSLAQGMLLNTIITQGLKAASHRERPNGSNAFSFPSGHTSSAFMWATVLQRYYGLKAGIPAYSAATFIGVSRLEKNVHFLSDVVAGAAFGYLVGRTVSRDAHKPPRVVMVPQISKNSVGVTLLFH